MVTLLGYGGKSMKKPRRDIVEALFMLTTRCNMKCPECLFDIPNRENPRDLTIEEIAQAAEHLYGIECLHLTGGEPTLHRDFAELAGVAKDMFGCRALVLSTNGWGAGRVPTAAFRHFDAIYATQYAPGFYPGFKGNKVQIDLIEQACTGGDTKLVRGTLGAENHVPRSTRPTGQPCHRAGIASVLVHAGRVYPCCASGAMWPETEDTEGVPLDANWRRAIFEVEMPCDRCFLSAAG